MLLLEQAQEDADHRVAREVALRALFHEDVGFVQEQDRVPHRADFEDRLQFAFQVPRASAELADVDHVQGFVQGLGRCFRGESLADSGRPVQQEEQAAAFALDDVSVNAALVVDQQLQPLLLRGGHHHLVDARGVEGDCAQRVDAQLAPLFRSEAEPVHARLAVLQVALLEVLDRPAPLPPRLVRVDFAERTLVDHHSARRSQFEGRLSAPREFDDVARIVQVAHLVSLPAE